MSYLMFVACVVSICFVFCQGEGDIFEVAWNFREDRIAACFSTSMVAVMDFRM